MTPKDTPTPPTGEMPVTMKQIEEHVGKLIENTEKYRSHECSLDELKLTHQSLLGRIQQYRNQELASRDERIAMLEREKDDLVDAIMSLHQISQAYPEDVFIPPTDEQLKQAHEVFMSVGLTLDKFSADCMRHVATQVGKVTGPIVNKESP